MPKIIKNPWRGTGLDLGVVMPIADASDVAGLLAHPRTGEIFGLPAVAQTALMLRERGLWPDDAPISMDAGRVASVLRPMLEDAR